MIVGIELLYLSPLREKVVVPAVPLPLIRQLREFGQVHPVIVRADDGGKFEILSNAETWLGVQRIGLHKVSISILNDIDDNEAARLINSASGGNPISEAEWFDSQLNRSGQGRGFSDIASLARSVGLSRSYVSHSIRLLNLNEPIKLAISTGAIEVGHAKILLGVKNEDQRTRLAAKVIQRKWSVRTLANEAKSINDQHRDRLAENRKSADIISLENRLSALLGSSVKIDDRAGTLTIDYRKNLEVLQGILNKIGYVEG